MKERKTKYLWRVLLFCAVILFAVPSVYMMQKPMQAEAAAKLSKKNASVQEGKTISLTVKNPTKTVTWKSSNSKVAKITKKSGAKKSKATIKGIKKGKVKITAKVGYEKLTATITVKHVHKYASATCTLPARCACGATKGSYLGHDKVDATCQRGAYCKRCGATLSDIGDHRWDSTKTCTVCGIMNLPDLIELRLTNTGGRANYLEVYVENKSYYYFEIGDRTVKDTAMGIAYDAYGVKLKDVFLGLNGYYTNAVWLDGVGSGSCIFAADEIFSMPKNGKLVFGITYKDRKYEVTVTETGFTYVPK